MYKRNVKVQDNKATNVTPAVKAVSPFYRVTEQIFDVRKRR